jgi:membrane glycosyltransferase
LRGPAPEATGHEAGIPPDHLLQDWRGAHARALAYLEALGIPEGERRELALECVRDALREPAWEAPGTALSQTLLALRQRLRERAPGGGPAPLRSTPPLARAPMVPESAARSRLRRAEGAPGAAREPSLRQRRRELAWPRVARRRRALLLLLVMIPSAIASAFMQEVLPHRGTTGLEIAIVIFFGALFGWISIGFWTALLGFWTLVRGRDRFAIHRLGDEAPADPALPGRGEGAAARTALVMPICDEPVGRVFAGLAAIHRSLERAGALELFHLFVLSDSTDPGTWVREEEAWADFCREHSGWGRVFYRHRRVRQKRKSGNVADFCRRFGRSYRTMVMLDADSLMTGEALLRLVRIMEAHPEVGIVQTVPVAVNRESLFARIQQFASRLYGPMFAAGLHYWQLGDGQYWGHNAIVRIVPFMQHCGLARLPGRPPLGGDILSHDFVEAALMGRAGFALWLAYDLPGSYEEIPGTLLEEMRRDRRWCQGNLQHLRLLFTAGLFGAHRALFLNGVLSYVSALLWLCFLSLSTAEAILEAIREPEYFPAGPSLFPEWPVWRPDWALSLLAVTAAILFLPKLLSLALVVLGRREARAWGGLGRLAASAALEFLASSLFAPIRMLFHSKFVLLTLLGRPIGWRSQARADDATGWGEAIRQHGLGTLVASAWGLGVYALNPDYFWWLTPIVGALFLSVPLSVLASRPGLGRRARAAGLFLIPEETAPPPELSDLHQELRAAEGRAARLPAAERDGFVRGAVDPGANALHRALLRGRRSLRPAIRAARRALLERALVEGPAALGAAERRVLLLDPDCVEALHRGVWELTDPEAARRWGIDPTALL